MLRGVLRDMDRHVVWEGFDWIIWVANQIVY